MVAGAEGFRPPAAQLGVRTRHAKPTVGRLKQAQRAHAHRRAIKHPPHTLPHWRRQHRPDLRYCVNPVMEPWCQGSQE